MSSRHGMRGPVLRVAQICWWVQLRPTVGPRGPWSSGFSVLEPSRVTRSLVTLARCPGAGVPGAGRGVSRLWEAGRSSGLQGGGCVRKWVGQLRCGAKMPSLETLMENRCGKRGHFQSLGIGCLEETLVPGARRIWGGFTQERAFGSPRSCIQALRAEEVTITDSESLFSPHLSTGLCPPHILGSQPPSAPPAPPPFHSTPSSGILPKPPVVLTSEETATC